MENDYSDILITAKQIGEYSRKHGLKKVLTSAYLWAIGVGAVMPGLFFGWNTGLDKAEPISFLLATLFVSALFLLIFLVFAELAANFPYAGAPYAYARKGLGTYWGFLAGFMAIMQFVCASAAICIMLKLLLSDFDFFVSPSFISLTVFFLFLMIHMLGARISAMVQMVLTVGALTAIMLFFMGIGNPFDSGIPIAIELSARDVSGVFFSIPATLWFYICMGSISFSAEEAKNPKETVPIAYITSVVTIMALSTGILIVSFSSMKLEVLAAAEQPLAEVLAQIQPDDHALAAVFYFLTVCGLFAGLHGTINGFSRQTFSLSRGGYLPKVVQKLFSVTKAPYLAILLPGIVGMVLSQIVDMKALISLTIYSALLMYLIVLISYRSIVKLEHTNADSKKLGRQLAAKISFMLCLIVLLLYSIQEFKYFCIMLVALIFASFYYLIYGRLFITGEAPEEAEARMMKILTKEKAV